jgi:NADH:ubiquinone reductase (H+-translocating)
LNRADRKKQTKQKILKAALTLFREKGFNDTTVQEITTKANVAKGTFFNHFPTKKSIMIELAQERIDTAIELLDEGFIVTMPIQKQIESLLNHLFAYYTIDYSLTEQMWKQVIKNDEAFDNLWGILIHRGVQRGEFYENTDITTWCAILNSHVYYMLSTSTEAKTKQRFIGEITHLISSSLEAIAIKRGNNSMEKLVLLGGGYGGMRIMQKLLDKNLPENVQITLIDRLPYHCLKTEYYALAAGTASDQHIRVSFPDDPRLLIKYGEITKIDLNQNQILLKDDEPVDYDKLIIGLGCEDKYHNVPGADEFTLSIQTIDASRETYQELNNAKPEAVIGIVGGGLSGIELASELHESRPDLKIKLFDRGESILSMFPRRLGTYVQNWFIERGVEIYNRSNITKVEENTLFNHDEAVYCDKIVWTAGIQANRIVREMEVEKDSSGRVVLNEYHQIPNYENAFVVGDCASLPHAPSAQLAEEQGEQIALVLQKTWNNEPLPELPEIKLKGVLGSLGKKHGFGVMANRPLTGRVPRLLKSGILWMYKNHSG